MDNPNNYTEEEIRELSKRLYDIQDAKEYEDISRSVRLQISTVVVGCMVNPKIKELLDKMTKECEKYAKEVR